MLWKHIYNSTINFEATSKYWNLTLATTIFKMSLFALYFTHVLESWACVWVRFVWHSNAKWWMSLFKSIIHFIKKCFMLTFHKKLKNTNESNLKAIIEASRNISHSFTWVNLNTCTKSMTKTSWTCASLIKNKSMFKRRTMKQGSREFQVH